MPTDEQRLVVSLEARINQLERGMKRAQQVTDRSMTGIERRSGRAATNMNRSFQRATSRISDSIRQIGEAAMPGGMGGLAGVARGGGIAGILVGAGVGGALMQTRRITRQFADLSREARRANVDLETFQEFQSIARRFNIGAAAMTDALKELQIRADEFATTGAGPAAEAFQRLGFTGQQVARQLQDPAEMFGQILERVRELDRAAQTRVLDEIFGGTGAEQVAALLGTSADEIRRMREEARQTGEVLDRELVERGRQLSGEIARLETAIGNNLRQAFGSAGIGFQEFYVGALRGLNDLIQKATEFGGALQARQFPGGSQPLDLGTIGVSRERQLAFVQERSQAPPDRVEDLNERTLRLVYQLMQEFPALQISPHGAKRHGTGGSQHNVGNAVDLLNYASPEAAVRIFQRAYELGARGFGYYAPTRGEGFPIHIDNREGPPTAWGPDLSERSVGQVPRVVQDWFASIDPGVAAILGRRGPPPVPGARDNSIDGPLGALDERRRAEAAEAAADAEQRLNEIMGQGQAIRERNATALERYVTGLEEASRLLQEGAISHETYQREVDRLATAYDKATEATDRLANTVPNVEAASASAAQTLGGGLVDTLFSLAEDGANAEQQLKRLALQMARMMAMGALFGQGPFGQIFGGVLGLGGGASASAMGNVVGPGGPIPLRRYAKGGVARSPHVALFGEGSTPEAFVPLPDGRTIPVSIRAPQAPAAMSAGGPRVVINDMRRADSPPLRQERRRGPGGGEDLIITIDDQIDNRVGGDIRSGGSTAAALEEIYGLRRRV